MQKIVRMYVRTYEQNHVFRIMEIKFFFFLIIINEKYFSVLNWHVSFYKILTSSLIVY